MKAKHYNLTKILSKNATYNIVIGERSNGKTFACLEYGLKKYFENKEQFAYIRRWREDLRGKRGENLFEGFVNNSERGNIISKSSKGRFNSIFYQSSRWYLQNLSENGEVKEREETPFCYGFALSESEHEKGMSYNGITTIILDEMITRGVYLDDEFIAFANTISTIKRKRENVRIFMLGNTISKYCPYFIEMGLKHIATMRKDTIDLYHYGNEKLSVAVEYTDSLAKSSKDEDYYFAFDNPKLKMITTGDWEQDSYPHCPYKFKSKDIAFTYFIRFQEDLMQCEIIMTDDVDFTFIHRKTTEIKNPESDLIYQQDFDPRPNYARKITTPVNPLQKKIASYFIKEKVFYQNNEIGEIVRNYLIWCKE